MCAKWVGVNTSVVTLTQQFDYNSYPIISCFANISLSNDKLFPSYTGALVVCSIPNDKLFFTWQTFAHQLHDKDHGTVLTSVKNNC